jgi:DNA (cytosine-5)-methyltransferase 1
MWRIKEARLDGDRVAYIPLGYLGLPREPAFGIADSPGPSLGGKDTAVKSVELFAGAGGLALGTAEAGFSHKVVIEWDSNACQTLRRNHEDGVKHVRDWAIVEGDVRDYDFLRHRGDVSFVSGGPPCQPFSIGGKHGGQDDDRNMFAQAVRAVREIRPRAFIFENVRGLLRESFSKYFGYIVHQLRYPTVTPVGDEEWTDHLACLERLHTASEKTDLRYNVVFQCVNAVDYGVPQHRWRVFIVGGRSSLDLEYSFPNATHGRATVHRDRHQEKPYGDSHHRIPSWPTILKRNDQSILGSWERGRDQTKPEYRRFDPEARSADRSSLGKDCCGEPIP